MAVPPDGRSESSAVRTTSGSLVHGVSTCGAWLNAIRKNTSSDDSSSSRKRATAARASRMRCPNMLSLTSSSRPSATGTRSRVNWVISCGSPSSWTEKASRGRSVASRPSASRTVTVTTVTSTLDRNVRGARRGGPCAAASPVTPHAIASAYGCARLRRRTTLPAKRPTPPSLITYVTRDSGFTIHRTNRRGRRSARVPHPGRDPIDGDHECLRDLRIRFTVFAEPSEQLDLDQVDRVDVRIAHLDRPPQDDVFGQKTLLPGRPEHRGNRLAEAAAKVGAHVL